MEKKGQRVNCAGGGPDRGWSWVIAFACCFINCLLYGLARMSGILLVAAVDAFQIPRGTAAMPFSASTSVRNLSGSFVGHLGQYFGLKPVIIAGCFLAALGAGLCFFVNDILWITVFWGGFFGLGSGLATTLLPVAINQHFRNQRGTASGISYSGSYIGSLAFPPLIVLLLDNYGFSGTFLVISAFVLNAIAAAMLFRAPSWVETPETENKFPGPKTVIKDDRKLKFRRRSCVRKLSEQYSSSEVREIVLRAQELDFWNQLSPKVVEGKVEDKYHVLALSQLRMDIGGSVRKPSIADTRTSNVTGKSSLDNADVKHIQKFWSHEGVFPNRKNVILKNRCRRKWAKFKRIWTVILGGSSYNLEATCQMQGQNEIKLVYFKGYTPCLYSNNNVSKGDSSRNVSMTDICSRRDVIVPIHEADETDDKDQFVAEAIDGQDYRGTESLHNLTGQSLMNGIAVNLSNYQDPVSDQETASRASFNATNNNLARRGSAIATVGEAKPRLSLTRRYSQNIAKRVSDTSSTTSDRLRKVNYRTSEPEVVVHSFIKGAGDCFFGWFRMFRNPMFVVIGGTQSLYTFVIVCVITIMEDFAKDLNAPGDQLQYAQMVLSTADLFGTLTLGWITDKGYMTRRHFMSLCFFGMTGSIMALSQSHSFPMLLGLLAVYGIFESGVVITFPLLTAQFIKPEKQAVAIASTNTLAAPVVLMVPLVIGHFRDHLGCYLGLFHLLSGTSLACGLVWLLTPYILRKFKACKLEPEIEIDMKRDRLRYVRPSC